MDFFQFWPPTRTSSARPAPTSSPSPTSQGTTISLTNPGGIGTVHSVPRLMKGQGASSASARIDYPAEFQGADETIGGRHQQGDHPHQHLRPPHHPGRRERRVPQAGARAAARRARLLRRHLPQRCASRTSRCAGPDDVRSNHDDDLHKTDAGAGAHPRLPGARAPHRRLDPLEYRQRKHPDLDLATYGLTIWDLDREFATGGFGGKDGCHCCGDPGRAARQLLPHHRRRVHAHPGPGAARWIQEKVEAKRTPVAATSRCASSRAQRGGGLRDVPADQVRRPEAVQPRGRRVAHRPARQVLSMAADAGIERSASAWPTAAASTCWPT
jgi:hypothetical protein